MHCNNNIYHQHQPTVSSSQGRVRSSEELETLTQKCYAALLYELRVLKLQTTSILGGVYDLVNIKTLCRTSNKTNELLLYTF